MKLINKAFVNAEQIYFLTTGEYTDDINKLDIDWPEKTMEYGEGGYWRIGEFYPCWPTLANDVSNIIAYTTVALRFDGREEIALRTHLSTNKSYCTASKDSDFANKVCKAVGGIEDSTVFTTAHNTYLLP